MKITIQLDGNQGNLIYAGQSVRGTVRVELKDEIKMRGDVFHSFVRSFTPISLCLVRSLVHWFICSVINCVASLLLILELNAHWH